MKRRFLIIALFTLYVAPNIYTQVHVDSPDGRLSVQLAVKEHLEPYPTGQRFYYSVSFNDQILIADSPFRLDFKNHSPFARDLVIRDVEERTVNQTWEPVWGTQKSIVNHYNEVQLTLIEDQEPQRSIEFFVRAFNDGVAFRYRIPEQEGITDFVLSSEQIHFSFTGDYQSWVATYPNFKTHQETEYNRTTLASIQPGDTVGCPLLVQTPSAWVALTEANLRDWAGLYFTAVPGSPGAVRTLLANRLDVPNVAVRSMAPRYSPWRVIMIGDKPGELIESNIIVNLADSCEINDPSWIKPGISAWDRWWCGSYAPDYPDSLQVDNASMKYFIDFAAEMGWDYQLVDWWWYGEPFNLENTITTPNPNIDIPELVEYAAEKDVKILIWLNWEHADKEMEKAFPLYEKWGVAGVKVDFMARDDQEMVQFYERLVKLAAQHRLTVDFHGAYKPTGLRRTYPNLLTREGVLGNEYNKWSDRITPSHNVTLAFTRMLCGPIDYTPGGFRNKTPETFRVVGSDAPGPFVMTTRAHQLAQFVVYESPLQVACDSPYNYRTSPGGLEFLKVVPTTWDDTKVIDGFPGEFIVIARQSADVCYLGALNNENARSITVPLSFLKPGKYSAHMWLDPDEAEDYPDRVKTSQKTVTAQNVLKLDLAGSGGAAIRFVKK